MFTEVFRINDQINFSFFVFSRFLYLPPTPTYSEAAATAFCIAIWGVWVPFTLGYVSIYTCLTLTIERWLAVVKPQIYRSLKCRHAILAVIVVWLWACAINITVLFRMKYDVATKKCKYVPIPQAETKLVWMDFTVQTLIPKSAMVVLYCHVCYTLKKLPSLSCNDAKLKKVTVVALVACSALIVNWLPGRITFMLSKYGIVGIDDEIHIACVMFTFLNSCVNPFLYFIFSPQYRREYVLVFAKLANCCKQAAPQVEPAQ
jgi:follicle stimulating hormone receptor